MISMLKTMTGIRGPNGFGSSSTAEQVTQGIDASNLTAIVTGGTTGIGLETVRVLTLRKAHVIMGVRNTSAAKEVKDTILKENPSARVDIMKLDVSSLRSVKAFADEFKAKNLPLNILINNAGIMYTPFMLSEDGFEMQFATNHLGHFYLTNLLLDKMKQTAKASGIEGRIVNVSSLGHHGTYWSGIRFDKINEKRGYVDVLAYGQSKLANILHANELSRRLREEGANITVNSLHPGLIDTNLYKYAGVRIFLIKALSYGLWKTAPQGAATSCYLALHPNVKGVSGKYFVDCNEYLPAKQARSETLAKKLWDFSNQVIAKSQI